MLIEQLDENKIKVTVDTDDQEEYGVTYESMAYSDCNTRKLCETIMERAKTEIGFNINGAKLLVEARKSVDGSVTLVLSKILSCDETKEELFGQTISFSSFDDICDCRTLFDNYKDIITATDIYCISNVYYLYFELICKKKQAIGFLRSILEYGEKADISQEYLKEHGTKVLLNN